MALTEIVGFLVGVGFLAGCTYAGFLAGRERAESRAHNTIANLRRANMGLRSRVERLEERNVRLTRLVGDAKPPAAVLPEWLRP